MSFKNKFEDSLRREDIPYQKEKLELHTNVYPEHTHMSSLYFFVFLIFPKKDQWSCITAHPQSSSWKSFWKKKKPQEGLKRKHKQNI